GGTKGISVDFWTGLLLLLWSLSGRGLELYHTMLWSGLAQYSSLAVHGQRRSTAWVHILQTYYRGILMHHVVR
ncbi:hypothetical protein HOY82DRAFT_486719, partial [Tuber indicum]